MASEQLQTILEMFRNRPRPEGEVTVEQTRAGMEAMMARPIDADITCTKVDAAGVPAEWIVAPGAEEGRALLYLHGGGYMIGSVNTHREVCARLARASGARVLSLDYRLAPENPFPAAVDDAVAAYRWLLGQGYEGRGLAIAGDSAGGGLTAATLVALRDQGVPLPAAAALISPWTDLALTGESLKTRAPLDPIVQAEGVGPMANAYLGGADPKTPLISPLYADLAGLPPLLIQVGTSEVLFDDAARLDARARCAGVEVRFEPWDDMFHVWHMFAGMLPEGQQAIEHIGAFLKEKTAAPAAV